MAVARTHHTKDYTCMSNYHFKDKSISLKAKGLLSLMLSLPDTWDYSVAGLASLSSDGETSVRTAVKELEEHKYLNRTPIRENGRIVDWEYDIYEKPLEILEVENQQVESLLLENTDNKILKQSNTKKVNINNSKELVQNSPSFEFGKPKQSKANMYTNCISMIDDFTKDTQVRIDLTDYLKLLFEMRKDGFAFYANNWKGLLRKLKSISKDPKEQHEIICQSIERGYKSFFPVNSYNNVTNKPWEKGVKSDTYTEDEKRQLAEEEEELIARGEKVWF